MKRTWLLVTAVGCAVLVPAGALAMSVGLTQADSGRRLQFRPGDTMRIALAENRTTPYWWTFAVRPSKSVLRLTSSKYVPNPTPPNFAGGGGEHFWTFKVVGHGSTSLKLVLSYLGKRKKIIGRFSIHVAA